MAHQRGKQAIEIVTTFFSIISPHTKSQEWGPFDVDVERDHSWTCTLSLRELHAGGVIQTGAENFTANHADKVSGLSQGLSLAVCVLLLAPAGCATRSQLPGSLQIMLQ